VYDRVEELLAAIESVQPKGIAQKRATFKAGAIDEVLTLRSELLIAFRLAKYGISFECPRFPDFACTGPYNGGIEVTTRSKDDLALLDARLAALPNPHRLQIHATGGRPVMGAGNLDRVVDAARAVLKRRQGETLHYSDLALTIVIGGHIDVSIDIEQWRAETNETLKSCVAQLPNIISTKTEQATRGQRTVSHPILLFVDASRFGAFGASLGVFTWVGAHAAIAAEMEPLDLGVFDAAAVAISNLQTNSYNGVIRLRAGLSDVVTAEVDLLRQALLSHP
jgi:hypothetical protein